MEDVGKLKVFTVSHPVANESKHARNVNTLVAAEPVSEKLA